jgi:hypothetical protein
MNYRLPSGFNNYKSPFGPIMPSFEFGHAALAALTSKYRDLSEVARFTKGHGTKLVAHL